MCKPPCRLGSIFAVEKSLPDFCSDFYFCFFSAIFLRKNSRKNRKKKIGTKIGTVIGKPSRGSAVWICKLTPCVLASGLWLSDKSQQNEQLLETCLCCASEFCRAPAWLNHIAPWLQWISLYQRKFFGNQKIGGKSGLQLAFTNELEAKKAHKPWIREGLNREVQTVN